MFQYAGFGFWAVLRLLANASAIKGSPPSGRSIRQSPHHHLQTNVKPAKSAPKPRPQWAIHIIIDL